MNIASAYKQPSTTEALARFQKEEYQIVVNHYVETTFVYTESVSYTHLDVYKRQVSKSLLLNDYH